jgi:predicted 2-oxoglutarate/Fe(II)-dependent dioxygenase YbiX
MDRGDSGPAEILDGEISVDDTVRRALDVTIAPRVLIRVEHAVARVRLRAADFFQVPLTGSVGATFLRYLEGGHYLRHRDCDPRPGSGTEDRRVSVVVWLNSGASDASAGEFGGGTLRLFAPGQHDAHEIIPAAGTLVAFPSEWPHEVLPVTYGTRDVVADWFL